MQPINLERTIFSNMHFVNQYWYFKSRPIHAVHNPPPLKILNINKARKFTAQI